MQQETPSVWVIVQIAVVLPVLAVLFFRIMTAKTAKAVAINYLLAMVAAPIVFFIFTQTGLGPDMEELRRAREQAPPLGEMLRKLPWEVFAAGALWIIGGNWIAFRQARKNGLSWWQVLNPFTPSWRYLDGKSWALLLLLAVLSLALAQVGLMRASQSRPGHAPATQSRP